MSARAESPAFAPAFRLTRGGFVESVHRAALAVVDAEGKRIAHLGRPDVMVFARSSLKPFQAIALAESGAIERSGLGEAELALAMASHRAEPFQIACLDEWMARANITERQLVCGAVAPEDAAFRTRWAQEQWPPSPRYHNCSGKHVGMLCACRALGLPEKGYAHPGHPLQMRIRAIVGGLIGRTIEESDTGVDGCGLPAPALRLEEVARAAARFSATQSGKANTTLAMGRLLEAMRHRPDMIHGAGKATERLVRATDGQVLVKPGAEGFLLAFLPGKAVGIALKIEDGAQRAAFPVMIATLRRVGFLARSAYEALEDIAAPPVLNSRKAIVGKGECCFADALCVAQEQTSA